MFVIHRTVNLFNTIFAVQGWFSNYTEILPRLVSFISKSSKKNFNMKIMNLSYFDYLSIFDN